MELTKTADYKTVTPEETMMRLETTVNGLSQQQADDRIRTCGSNEISENEKSALLFFLSRYWGPMPWLLELTMVLSCFLRHYPEAVIIFILLGINAVIGFWNQRKSRKALELLKSKLSVQSKILRSGTWVTRNAKELVPGDIISIGLGDIVTADIKIINDSTLSADQSAITGESLAVSLERSSIVFSGSIIQRGEAEAVVLNTGIHTYFGKTVELVSTAQPQSHQQEIMMAMVRYIMYAALGAILLVSIDALLVKAGLISILMVALIFLMGAVPVALPAVFTVVLATGAMELSRKNVLVTKLSAIEDAASMKVLLLDKTGTITQNTLSVSDPIVFDGYSKETVSMIAAMASRQESNDSMDASVIAYAKSVAGTRVYKQISFTAFNPELKRSESVVDVNGEKIRVVKGAYQTVVSLCKPMDEHTRSLADASMNSLSVKGYRVLAVARSQGSDFDNLELAGLLPLSDPPRPDSKEMIQEMKELGIKVKMLTGDNGAIAHEIARQVGIGDAIAAMSDIRKLNAKDQADILERLDGIAEIYPEDKFQIVKLLQSKGYIVGMTGDGVNDSPALKQAEVGIAVSNATDVTKASASIVMTQPGLETIKLAIVTSRKIYQRMLTWVINKITKVIQLIGLLSLGFFLLHNILLTAMGMVLWVFASDFVGMSIATDNVETAVSPDNWNIKNVTLASLVIGILLVTEGVIAVAVGKWYFHMNFPVLQSFILLLLVFTSQFKILIVRERRHFWSSMPGKTLLLSVFLTIAAFAVMGLYGWLTAPITSYQLLFVLFFSAGFTLLLDIPKYYIFKRYGL